MNLSYIIKAVQNLKNAIPQCIYVVLPGGGSAQEGAKVI